MYINKTTLVSGSCSWVCSLKGALSNTPGVSVLETTNKAASVQIDAQTTTNGDASPVTANSMNDDVSVYFLRTNAHFRAHDFYA